MHLHLCYLAIRVAMHLAGKILDRCMAQPKEPLLQACDFGTFSDASHLADRSVHIDPNAVPDF